jgi:hypothetical protein
MKRGKKSSADSELVTKTYVKSTYLLDPIVKENVQYVALSEKKEQSDVVREAIASYLIKKGLDPHKRPAFVFSS